MGGGDAVQSKSVGDFDSQLPSQHEAVINIGARLEAESPRVKIKAACQCNPAVINGELPASEASNKSDETERQMTRVRTDRHIPVILDGKDGDVEGGVWP